MALAWDPTARGARNRLAGSALLGKGGVAVVADPSVSAGIHTGSVNLSNVGSNVSVLVADARWGPKLICPRCGKGNVKN